MTFKSRGRANTAMPAQILICQCSRSVARQKCTYGNMADSKLLDLCNSSHLLICISNSRLCISNQCPYFTLAQLFVKEVAI